MNIYYKFAVKHVDNQWAIVNTKTGTLSKKRWKNPKTAGAFLCHWIKQKGHKPSGKLPANVKVLKANHYA